MKRVRWDVAGMQFDNGDGTVLRSDPGGLFEMDYRGHVWREIESTEYVSETGAIRLVLKPVIPSLGDAWKDFKAAFPHITDGELVVAKNMQSAIEREVAKPSLLVDEFLDATIERNKNGTQFDLRWFFGDPSILVEEGSMRLYKAFHALLKEREAAK